MLFFSFGILALIELAIIILCISGKLDPKKKKEQEKEQDKEDS